MTFFARTRELLASPVVALLAGILCTLLSLRLSEGHIQPVYLAESEPISHPRIRSVPGTDQLFGDDGRKAAHAGMRAPPATCLARVAFWNNGSQIITADRFTSADPLRIIATQPIELYQFDIIHKSRNTLRFHVTPHEQALHLEVADGDGLDPLDGVVFRLLYAGDCDAGFAIQGRIIGAERIGYRGESTADFKGWYAIPVLGPIFIIFTAFLTYMAVYKHVRGYERTSMGVAATIMWLLFGFIAWHDNPFREPPWRPTIWLHKPSARAQKASGAPIKTRLPAGGLTL